MFDERDPVRQRLAGDLVYSLADGVSLWQVAIEFIPASRKFTPRASWPASAWKHVSELRGLMKLVLPREETLEKARELSCEHQVQFWDASIYAACLEAKIQRLYSEDVPGQAIAGLEIVNPFGAL